MRDAKPLSRREKLFLKQGRISCENKKGLILAYEEYSALHRILVATIIGTIPMFNIFRYTYEA